MTVINPEREPGFIFEVVREGESVKPSIRTTADEEIREVVQGTRVGTFYSPPTRTLELFEADWRAAGRPSDDAALVAIVRRVRQRTQGNM